MIQYTEIFIHGLEIENKFAFYNTITDSLISFSGECLFNSWKDFEEYYNMEKDPYDKIERFKGIYIRADKPL